MNMLITWVLSCLVAAGLGLAGGLWLGLRRHGREAAPSTDAAALAALQSHLKTLFEAQGVAIAGAHRTAREEHARTLERQPLLLQRALEVELTRYAALQARRDEALAGQLAAFRDAPAVAQPAAPSPVLATHANVPTGMSPRPPELLHVPIQPSTRWADPEPVARELSDAELDAMPPELPPISPRKRLLPTPKSPVMGRL